MHKVHKTQNQSIATCNTMSCTHSYIEKGNKEQQTDGGYLSALSCLSDSLICSPGLNAGMPR